MKRVLAFFFLALSCLSSVAQQLSWEVVKVNKQQKFTKTVPPANYSGIAHIHGNLYAVVDDKSPRDGFYLFAIDIDSVNGRVLRAERLDFRGNEHPNRDAEGIAFDPESQHIYISGERDNHVLEYTIDGQRTGQRLSIPQFFRSARPNAGLESLTYDAHNHTFWTTTELPLPADSLLTHRLQRFNSQMQPDLTVYYRMDETEKRRRGRSHVHGISELLSVGPDSLLVLERELFVPKQKIGARVINKLYLVSMGVQGYKRLESEMSSANTDSLSEDNLTPLTNKGIAAHLTEKRLLCRWQTRMNLTRRSLANYEAMCLGPRLKDGSQVILLMADSQNRFKGLLRDWFRTIIVR